MTKKVVLKPREAAINLWRDNHFDGVPVYLKAFFTIAFHLSVALHWERFRKSGERYYFHDCRAAARALAAKFPIIVAIVMLIHELIEDDEGWSSKKIARYFNKKIARIVAAVSKGPKTKFKSRLARINNHIDKMKRAIKAGLWEVAMAKLLDRVDNTTDTAGLSDVDERRLFIETDSHFLPFFYWARPFIPKQYRSNYDVYIKEIEFASDNYWRSQALLK